MKKILDKMLFYILGIQKYEEKLRIYDGYAKDSILLWKQQTGFSWKLLKKILENLTIYSAMDIRKILKEQYEQNKELFEEPNSYFTSFGEEGKSGSIIIYQLRHAMPWLGDKIIDSWQIGQLPSGSRIIFVDDLIGTGEQSTEYINKKLNLFMNSSYECYLLSLCGTKDGIYKVETDTNFKVICAITLMETDHEYLCDKCTIFSEGEKEILQSKNQIITSKSDKYNKGLLLAFSHSVPNNTMPIIWKGGYKYEYEGVVNKWVALLPRRF